MQASPFQMMQSAVDVVLKSPHPANKIAATLSTPDGFTVSDTNHWPPVIVDKIGTATKIGNSSGTMHAETACLIQAMQSRQPSLGASLFITDPPCPNCAKNIAEAGILNVYIDHKGFEKDFAQRRSEDIQKLSLQVFKHAGINVYKIFRKEERLDPLHEAPENYTPENHNPAFIEKLRGEIDLNQELNSAKVKHSEEPFALCIGSDKTGQSYILNCEAHPSLGYETARMLGHIDNHNSKYSTLLEPVNRLLMLAARHGLKIEPNSLFSSRVPTSRELVNLIGTGLESLIVGNENECRDEFGKAALEQLKKAGILKTRPLEKI